MKRVFLIGGTMGVGKTTVCKALKRHMPNSVFLDGDWCWDSDPFQVTDETKEMVIENICFMLNQFIHCSAYDNVIFCWVMHDQKIINTILSGIDKTNCSIKVVSLFADESTIKNRLMKDINNGIRSFDVIERSVDRLPKYVELDTQKIGTTDKSIDSIISEIDCLL